eukprot:TRINITY_DN4077_c0_g1_i1.p1 TRINITY_DN4077_c0_g1~~TRINITY_DN4077_c0_g1_i1.p1  ORF type:complete len:334 (-),score=65.70 TRINITY_DN4077_c0_g1_i1:28-1029(-)
MAETKPRVALSTTENFRLLHKSELITFIKRDLLWLAHHTSLWLTGTTYDTILLIMKDLVLAKEFKQEDLQFIKENTSRYAAKSAGIIAATHDVVEGRIRAVFHLSHYKDMNSSFAIAVFQRQALVHDIIYADTVQSITYIVNNWRRDPTKIDLTSQPTTNLVDVETIRKVGGRNNIALIAHDGKKLDIALLVVQYMETILKFDQILCTGTTGGWIRKYLNAALSLRSDLNITPAQVEAKLRICESGPKGGDVQIAHVALEGLCDRIIFLIDPMTAHPHEPDIKFLEQVIESAQLESSIRVATSVESAKYLLNDYRYGPPKVEWSHIASATIQN